MITKPYLPFPLDKIAADLVRQAFNPRTWDWMHWKNRSLHFFEDKLAIPFAHLYEFEAKWDANEEKGPWSLRAQIDAYLAAYVLGADVGIIFRQWEGHYAIVALPCEKAEGYVTPLGVVGFCTWNL